MKLLNLKIIINSIMVSTFILLTAGCSGNEHKNIAETDLKLWAKDQKIIDIKSIKWGGSEETGTPTSPKTKYRLDVDFQVVDQTYIGQFYIKWLNVRVIAPDFEKGHIISKTLFAEIYKKDGKVIVEWNNRPRFIKRESGLFEQFMIKIDNNIITADDIIIKGQTNSSKAYSKLNDYWDKNYPIYEKLDSEIPPEIKNQYRFPRSFSNDEKIGKYLDLRRNLDEVLQVIDYLR
jgi:hypothetical protein